MLRLQALHVLLLTGSEEDARQAFQPSHSADAWSDCSSDLKGVVCSRVSVFRITFFYSGWTRLCTYTHTAHAQTHTLEVFWSLVLYELFHCVFPSEVGFSVQVCMNMSNFEWTVPTLIVDYHHYLSLHYFLLGWVSDITGLDVSPLLQRLHAAASALSPSINSDPGSHAPCYSSCPRLTQQAEQPPGVGTYFRVRWAAIWRCRPPPLMTRL